VFFLLPLILYSLAFIICVEIPDVESDKLGGKETLIVRRGPRMGSVFVVVLFGVSTLYFLVLAGVNPLPMIDFLVLTLFSLIPLFWGLWEYFKQSNGGEFSTKSVKRILLAFVFFLLLIDSYLVTRILISI
jgi:1,4-dihydroxy-2-naphthoate octaprenyltransferase